MYGINIDVDVVAYEGL